ncbi:hypothetical protein J437_LFUL006277 [Ladona fulva]|uniref:SMP-30/Gluconolactonase/LRE-like region domain-containing protein n=1 Tax=Ladona fulva TaxID=123851 RepID=A0A8K0JYY3_LADFU|nr:hypothetical protein J437_LFUL006277 [Ladona fulva]
MTEVTWDGENIEGVLEGRTLVTVDSDKPDNRFNDGKADPKGRLWAGTMGPEPEVGVVTPKQGSLFTFKTSVNGIVSAVTHLREIDISNGLAWSSDNSTMYYIDTGKRAVFGFNFNIEEGEISRRRVILDFESNNITGSPDGMTIDRDGNLWVACFGGSQFCSELLNDEAE